MGSFRFLRKVCGKIFCKMFLKQSVCHDRINLGLCIKFDFNLNLNLTLHFLIVFSLNKVRCKASQLINVFHKMHISAEDFVTCCNPLTVRWVWQSAGFHVNCRFRLLR